MGTYNVPRNVKGEGRILFIFSTKSLNSYRHKKGGPLPPKQQKARFFIIYYCSKDLPARLSATWSSAFWSFSPRLRKA